MSPRCQLLSRSLVTPRVFLLSPQPSPRSFTTSPQLAKNPLKARKGGDLGSHLPKHILGDPSQIPPYPYGSALLYKQSNTGLYGGQMIQFGNNVSPDTETKTRRHWKPNVLNKNLYSIALKKKIRLRVTAGVLKIIDREGGLDEYLLKEDTTRIKELGPMGWALRWRIMQTPEIIAQFRAKAEALGLAKEVIDQNWPIPEPWKPQTAPIEQPQKENDQNGDQEKNKRKSDEERIASEERRLALRAAKRYVKRGLVDTVEDGLKLAFLRSEHRLELRARQSDFLEKVKAMGGLSEYVREQREQRKGRDLASVSPEKAALKAQHAARIEALGGPEVVLADARKRAAKEIEDAMNSRDEFSRTALSKAQDATRTKSTREFDKLRAEIDDVDSWASPPTTNNTRSLLRP